MTTLGGVLLLDLLSNGEERPFASGALLEVPLHCVQSINEAIRLVRQREFTHYVVRSSVTDQECLEAFEMLKLLLPQAPGTVVTNTYSPEFEVAARSSGAVCYFSEPISGELLAALLALPVGEVAAK